MFASLMLTIPALVVPLLQAPTTRDCQFGRLGDPAEDARSVAAFTDAVEAYADLRRMFDRGLFPEWMEADREQAEFVAAELAATLRDTRPNARIGDFFKPAVAELFRFRIATALREHNYDLAALTATDDGEGGVPEFLRPTVNRPLPWGVGGAFWPAAVQALPLLPRELEYRFVGRDLVLLDTRSNLVIDILELALPTAPAPLAWARRAALTRSVN